MAIWKYGGLFLTLWVAARFALTLPVEAQTAAGANVLSWAAAFLPALFAGGISIALMRGLLGKAGARFMPVLLCGAAVLLWWQVLLVYGSEQGTNAALMAGGVTLLAAVWALWSKVGKGLKR